jgi:putative ABC transport system ATP-binding protein
MLLAAQDLAFRHPGGAGVGPVSFTLDKGQKAVLLGPSGSGKTTLVHLLSGLLTPQQGTLLIDGVPLYGQGPAHADRVRRQTIGVVFQSLRLVSALDVVGNLALARRLAGRAEDPVLIMSLLDRLGIAGRARAFPRTLSQGEAQRAAVARALAAEPRLLIADEPTSALDDAHAEATSALFEECAAVGGAALLIVTHDRRIAGRFVRHLSLQPSGLMEAE